MDKEFVSYEQALSLKELGFDEECFAWYNYGELLEFGNDHILDMYAGEDKKPVAPLKQQVFRFFREKYNYNHSIIFHKHPFGTNDYQYMILLEDDEYVEVNFNLYEEAENACIDKLIEIAKQK